MNRDSLAVCPFLVRVEKKWFSFAGRGLRVTVRCHCGDLSCYQAGPRIRPAEPLSTPVAVAPGRWGCNHPHPHRSGRTALLHPVQTDVTSTAMTRRRDA